MHIDVHIHAHVCVYIYIFKSVPIYAIITLPDLKMRL